MPDRSNPIHLRYLPQIDVSEERVDELIADIRAANEAVAEFKSRSEKLTQQRYGIKARQRVSPWPGASDLRIPTQDKVIRRWKPKIISLVYDAERIAYFRAVQPDDVESARKAEQLFDWLFRVHMDNTLFEVCYLADYIAHRGFGFMQIDWHYETEDETRVVDCDALFGPPEARAEITDDDIVQVLAEQYQLYPDEIEQQLIDDIRGGAERVVLYFQTTIADKPRVIARDATEVIAPARATDPANARFIAIRHIVDRADLRQRGRDGRLWSGAVEMVLENLDNSDAQRAISPVDTHAQDEQRLLDRHEGVTPTPREDREDIEILEVFTWSEAPERRRVKYWLHVPTATVLAAHPYVMPFHRWPLVKFDAEKTTRRWTGARGLSKMLSPLALSINRLHNAKLDAIKIQLAPAFKYRSPAGAVPRQFRFRPGTIFPVSELSDFEPVVQDLRNIPLYTQEEYQTRQYAEDYAGVYDSSLMSPMNPTERRTATEVNYVAEQMQGAFSLDAKLFQLGMTEVYKMVWALWYEFGPRQVNVRVANEEEPLTIQKHEVVDYYDIVPAGTPANTNKALELSRAREAMQLLGMDQSMVINREELFRWYLELLDWNLSKRVIRGPEGQLQMQLLTQAAGSIAGGELEAIMSQAAAAQQMQMQGGAPANLS